MNLDISIIILAVILALLLLCVIILSILLIGEKERRERQFYMIRQGDKFILKSVKVKATLRQNQRDREKRGKKRETHHHKDNYYTLEDVALPYNIVNPLHSVYEVDQIAERILRFCRESEDFLDKDFKLDNLAYCIGSNRNYTSKALNNIIQLNFNQLKNYYRIYSACNYFILNPNTSAEKLFEISKFTSFSSFASSFDKYTGFSPSKWCKDVVMRLHEGEEVSLCDYIKDRKIKNYHEVNIAESKE